MCGNGSSGKTDFLAAGEDDGESERSLGAQERGSAFVREDTQEVDMATLADEVDVARLVDSQDARPDLHEDVAEVRRRLQQLEHVGHDADADRLQGSRARAGGRAGGRR